MLCFDRRYLVAITGASGLSISILCVKKLLEQGFFVDVVYSKSALVCCLYELKTDLKVILNEISNSNERCKIYCNSNIAADVCSGSCKRDGMIIVPCSMSTLACIAHGISDNLIKRTADVFIKEKRSLVIVPRETPLSVIHIKNLLILAELGVSVIVPCPAWYMNPKTIEDVEMYIVGKIFDSLKLEHDYYSAWT